MMFRLILADDSKMMTAKELAAVLNVSEKTVYRLALKNTIPCYREGRIVRFDPDDVKHHILSHKRRPSQWGSKMKKFP